MEEKEKRVRSITALYYSNPGVAAALAAFAKDREVVPRYFEQFGKRPDTIQYPSDIHGLVKRGATSFHASEEIWSDPMQLNSEMTQNEMHELRKAWDLLIDIDSPFLDCSKIAAQLIIAALEQHGVKNCGIKFSGSKGFHLIVPAKAFPETFNEMRTKEMFPDWPRAICSYLMDYIRRDYNRKAGEIMSVAQLEKRTSLSSEELQGVRCGVCNKPAQKGEIVIFICSDCKMRVERKNPKLTNKRLKCLRGECAGILEKTEERNFFYCENCKDPENEKLELNSEKYPERFEKRDGGFNAEKVASLDLVLVAPRHLFRMPYSLHEKTALASVVLDKNEIENFDPRMASPMGVVVRAFVPQSDEGEAMRLLAAALSWKGENDRVEKKIEDRRYIGYSDGKNFSRDEIKNVPEELYPEAIKKLMLGLEDGRKRGLFVLITFLRVINVAPEEIALKVRAWNEKNKPPLREGYVKSQIDWHFRQKKKILPPNYSNDAFYRDLGLISGKQETKNPAGDVARAMRQLKRNNN